MTIDTIKNVLLRILSINKNLNEESLHNLLVASGWDESDIKEGINIFRSYKLSGGDSDSVSEYKIAKVEEIADTPKVMSLDNANIKKVIDYKVLDGKDLMEDNKILVDAVENNNVISLLDNHVSEPSFSIPEAQNVMPTLTPMPTTPEVAAPETHLAQPNVPLVQTTTNYVAHESHLDSGELDAYEKREGKPIFLVILDVILFLVTLGLLIYILLS